MKKFIVACLLCFALSGCAAYNALTSATVNPSAVYIAENSFDAIEITATGYLRICRTAAQTPGCSKTAIANIIPAVRAGRVARVNLDSFMKSHPDGLGAQGLYDALIAATNTLQGVATQYNISGVIK